MSLKIPPSCFENRDISQLNFSRRVLEQVFLPATPLFDKLKFLSIFTCGLDEFFAVRTSKPGKALPQILDAARELYKLRDRASAFADRKLLSFGIERRTQPTEAEYAHFKRHILPTLTRLSLTPFTRLDPSLRYLCVHDGEEFSLYPLPRLSPVPGDSFITLDDLMLSCARLVCPRLKHACILRITRSARLNLNNAPPIDYVNTLLAARPHLPAVRLEVYGAFKPELAPLFQIDPARIFRSRAPLDYSHIKPLEPLLPKYPPLEELPCPHFTSADLLTRRPEHGLAPVLKLLENAADDPSTASIKICLYRLAESSQIAKALIRAARRGVKVTALVELRARFDEAANLALAAELKAAGVQVICGAAGYKVHAKILLITQIRGGKPCYITHISTGNYNELTARAYTDLDFFTRSPDIGKDALRFFSNLTSPAPRSLLTLIPAPERLKLCMLRHIKEEIRRAHAGNPARIRLKMNALTDKALIRALIRASRAGVKIDLIIRGACALRPGIPGFTHNIRLKSIVGRFLEHSRIFIFGADDPAVYLSSADWMERNTERRRELACPIRAPSIKSRLITLFDDLMG